ncbi:MAG: hypothetical protein JW999_10670 [Methanotrichaceae archaeon]|nr:hypothetical protein [Methanotrichaceae archaeon]
MNLKTCTIALGLLLLFLSMPNVNGVTVTTSCSQSGNNVGTSTTYGMPIDAEISSFTTLLGGGVGISQTIIGSGDLTDSRSVSNSAGSYASEGVTINNAESYVYTYYLYPGEGSGWSASLYPEVSAGESLNVNHADYIKAYAQAHNNKGYSAVVSTEISDPSNGACLLGYSNNVVASSYKVTAAQNANQAIGITNVQALANDKRGREAKSIADFIGSYSENQAVSIDRSHVFASQQLQGKGDFEGALTYAKDGKGNEALSREDGSFSGEMGTNKLEALVDASRASASQEVEFEYEPVSYGEVGTWDKTVFGAFSTSTNFNNNIATASQEISHSEHYQNTLESASTANTAGSNLNSYLIGVAIDSSVLAKGMKEKEARSWEDGYTGVYFNEQSAMIDRNAAKATLNMRGVGYSLSTINSANDGKGHQAIVANTASLSGNMIMNSQGAQASNSGTLAYQDSELEYMPISYSTGTYDQCIFGDFTSWATDGVKTEANAEEIIRHGEHFQQHQMAFTDGMTAEATNDAYSIGVASGSVSAKDMKGKEARSWEDSYTGVYSNEQSALIDRTTAKATLNLKGVGYFQGSMTSANYGRGYQAVASAEGASSGNLITNRQNAQASNSGTLASQENELEYQPVSYQTGAFDHLIGLDFTSWAKYGAKTEAKAEEITQHGEHFQQHQMALADGMTAEATNDANSIGVASGSVLAKDMRGKEARSWEDGYTGIYSNEQSAMISRTAAKAILNLKGMGYFQGATTSARDGRWKEAITSESGAFSGDMYLNGQNALVDASKAHADQDVSLGYSPVDYQGVTYDASWLTFDALTKARRELNPVTEEKKDVFTPYDVNQDVSAP